MNFLTTGSCCCVVLCCVVKCFVSLQTSKAIDICLLSSRRELSYFGVKVAIIEPGGFKTPLNDRHLSIIKMLWDQASTEVKEIYGEKFLQSCE